MKTRPSSKPAAARAKVKKDSEARILFADPDEDFLQSLLKDRKAAALPPLIASLGNQAMEIIGNPEIELCAILVNPRIVAPDAISIIRRAHHLRPHVTVIVIYEGERCPMDPALLEKHGVHETLRKGFSYSDIARQFIAPALLFNPEDAIQTSHRDSTPAGQMVSADDAGFAALRIEGFLSGNRSLFDLYIRLESGKYLKLLRAGDEFSSERLANYVTKGVKQLHIRRESLEQYLAYSDRVTSAVVSHPSLPPEVKTTRTLTQGEQILAFLRSKTALDAESARFAESYVSLVHKLVEELGLEKQNRIIESFMKAGEFKDHCLGVVVLGGLLASQLGLETKKSAKIVGLSCLFHDIALLARTGGVEHEEEERMSPEQKKVYHQHPVQGAKILSDLRGVDSVVATTVANHHRRRNGTGFPNSAGMGSSKIPLTAEIVGLADEVSRLLLRDLNATSEQISIQLEATILSGFSSEVNGALKRILQLT